MSLGLCILLIVFSTFALIVKNPRIEGENRRQRRKLIIAKNIFKIERRSIGTCFVYTPRNQIEIILSFYTVYVLLGLDYAYCYL